MANDGSQKLMSGEQYQRGMEKSGERTDAVAPGTLSILLGGPLRCLGCPWSLGACFAVLGCTEPSSGAWLLFAHRLWCEGVGQLISERRLVAAVGAPQSRR